MTYSDVGGCKEQIEKLREVVEVPLLHVRTQNVFYFLRSLSRYCLMRSVNCIGFKGGLCLVLSISPLIVNLVFVIYLLPSNEDFLNALIFQPERFVNLGIEPPKGVLLFGPPGTGKTLCARAVANRTDACFIRVIGSELVQKYVGEVCRVVVLADRHFQSCSKDDICPKQF